MTGYTKLFSSIVTSTIWQEDLATKVVWITLLALSDSDGTVEGSVPGLAHLAGVSVEECERSLAILQQPDKYSRTPDHDGRRIEVIDGGWFILNRAKYRDKHWQEDKAERRRQRNHRYYASHRNSDNSDAQRLNVSESDRVRHKKEKEKEKYKYIRAKRVSLPEGFAISDQIRAWALAKGFTRLEERLTHFVGYARANGKTYADWQQAFQNAIRDDWAKLNGHGNGTQPPKRVTVNPADIVRQQEAEGCPPRGSGGLRKAIL
jgi:hypothetical protein